MNPRTIYSYSRLLFFLLAGVELSLPSVLAQPAITVQPATQAILPGSNVTFRVAMDGMGPFAYQWQFNGTNLPNNIINTVAGRNSLGFAGDGGAATNAALYYPQDVALDALGNLYIADASNNRIRKVDTNGVITTVAGKAASGYAGDGGAATNATLKAPAGVTVDGVGNLFIADTSNNRIRKVDTQGIITTVAGTGSSGFSGDGDAATNAALSSPRGVAVDALGNLYFADYSNNRVRRVDTNGLITTVAGTGSSGFSGDGGFATNASLSLPNYLAVDFSGAIYISDSSNARVRRVDATGMIATVAGGGSGGDGGAATTARLFTLGGVTWDVFGNLFVGEYSRVRRVDTNGMITTAVGTSSAGYSGDGGAATNAKVFCAGGIAFDPVGNLYVDDQNNHRVRWVNYAGQPTLTLTNVTTNQAGSYTVVVTSPSGSVTSTPALLLVGYPPVFIGQPVNRAALAGSSATFNAWPGGTPPFNCSWYFNATNLVQASDRATLTLPAVAAADVGNYTLVVSNPWGTITSLVATLTLALPPSFTTEPSSQTAWTGSNVTFTATASGSGPVCYRWMHNGAFVPNYFINTVAGYSSVGYSGDTGPATNASLSYPTGVAFDLLGNLYCSTGHRVRKVDTRGIITTVAGNGSGAFAGDGGLATNASLYSPLGLACDAYGNLYIADSSNNRVRKVDVKGVITTVAGNGTSGFSGEGGPATNAAFHTPSAVIVDNSGAVYVTDADNNRVRRIAPNGVVTTVAGNGTAGYAGDGGWATNASLWLAATTRGVGGLALDEAGNLYFADTGNHSVRRVDTKGIIMPVAGMGSSGFSGDGGQATFAKVNTPRGIALDGLGNLFIVENANQRIRRVDPSGLITTLAGNGSYGYAGDGGTSANAWFYYPAAVAVDGAGNVFVADSYNQRIREISGASTLTLSNLTAAEVGDYSLIVTSPWASVTSHVASLTLEGPPVILTQPAAQALWPGGTATFNVTATGTAPLGYAWLFNGTNLLADATNALLTLADVAVTNAGAYTVIITNGYGAVTSAPAALAVDFIAAQPVNQTAVAGDMVTLSVAVAGAGPFTYQWRLNGTNLPNNLIRTVAGQGSAKYSGDGGPATAASLNRPYDVAADAAGNLYIADFQNGRVRKVDANGIITTLVAGPSSPTGVALDGAGNLYIADYYGSRVRKRDTNGVLTVVAGGGTGGDGGFATNASLFYPETVVLDASGNLFIADNMNQRIRKVDSHGIITTVAGTTYGFSGDGGLATGARFDGPSGVALDAAGNLYVADFNNNRVRKVDTRDIITTVAGSGPLHSHGYAGDGGPATNALMYAPSDVGFDQLGNLYIADAWNSRIRKVDANGIITTVAGGGSLGDGEPAVGARLYSPRGLGLDSSGNLYIADTDNNRIREVPLGGHPTLTLNPVSITNAGDYSVVISGPRGSMTSAVATLTVRIRPAIAHILPNPDGSITLNCTGTPTSTNRLWFTTTLEPPVAWSPLATTVAGNDGTWQFTDTNAPGSSVRFYRVSMP
jgi:sugar lactone lactonase YvrE